MMNPKETVFPTARIKTSLFINEMEPTSGVVALVYSVENTIFACIPNYCLFLLCNSTCGGLCKRTYCDGILKSPHILFSESGFF